MNALVNELDAVLPQTQCTKCGFAGCRPYAQAIVEQAVAINRCPPGGDAGVARLAQVTGREVIPLDTTRGASGLGMVALIDEQWCIGCTLCIQACPVDAIVGAAKSMHTVLFAECTGCELCIEPCPVDCIEMRSVDSLSAAGAPGPFSTATDWRDAADRYRTRFEARTDRLNREKRERDEALASKAARKLENLDTSTADADRKRAVIEAALQRARARRLNTDNAK